jgi:hypothetical protein
MIEATYGEDMLNLVVATGYVSRLISNRRIASYLDDNHPEIVSGFRAIVTAEGAAAIHQKADREAIVRRRVPDDLSP